MNWRASKVKALNVSNRVKINLKCAGSPLISRIMVAFRPSTKLDINGTIWWRYQRTVNHSRRSLGWQYLHSILWVSMLVCVFFFTIFTRWKTWDSKYVVDLVIRTEISFKRYSRRTRWNSSPWMCSGSSTRSSRFILDTFRSISMTRSLAVYCIWGRGAATSIVQTNLTNRGCFLKNRHMWWRMKENGHRQGRCRGSHKEEILSQVY